MSIYPDYFFFYFSENFKDDVILQEPTTKIIEPTHSPVIKSTSPRSRKPVRTYKGHGNRDRSNRHGKKSQEITEIKISPSSPPDKRLEIAWVYPLHSLIFYLINII